MKKPKREKIIVDVTKIEICCPKRTPAKKILRIPCRGQGMLHVEAGVPNYWEPTPEDMDRLASLFADALAHTPNHYVTIVTRGGVSAKWIKLKTKSKTASRRA